MKKTLNLFALILALCIVAVGVGGCGINKERKIIRHLEKKYGEEFTYVERYGGNPLGSILNTDNVTSIYCTNEKYPGVLISASYVNDEDKFYDNYLSITYAEQLDEFCYDMLNRVYGENQYVFAYPFSGKLETMLPTKDDLPEMSFEQYIKQCEESMVVFALCDNETADEVKVEELKKELEKTGVYFRFVRVFYAPILPESREEMRKIQVQNNDNITSYTIDMAGSGKIKEVTRER